MDCIVHGVTESDTTERLSLSLFLLGLTGLITLQSKGLSGVSSSTTVQKHQLAFSLLYGPALTSIHDYGKNHSFDYMDLCWQSDVSAF